MTTPTPSKTPRADAGIRVSVYGDVRCDMEVARLLELELNAERATSATLVRDLAAAKEALRKQGQSALMGMDAAKAIASHNLESAKALNAQSNPAALDEARALNERLTNELEAAQEARQLEFEKRMAIVAENCEYKERAQAAESKQTALEVTVRELTGSMERAEKNARDAERYRHIFEDERFSLALHVDGKEREYLDSKPEGDAAIDAAIAGGKK